MHISILCLEKWHFPGGAPPVAQMVKKTAGMQETQVWSLGWKDPLEKGMATTPVFLPGESHGPRSLAGCSPRGHRAGHDWATDTFTFTNLWNARKYSLYLEKWGDLLQDNIANLWGRSRLKPDCLIPKTTFVLSTSAKPRGRAVFCPDWFEFQ